MPALRELSRLAVMPPQTVLYDALPDTHEPYNPHRETETRHGETLIDRARVAQPVSTVNTQGAPELARTAVMPVTTRETVATKTSNIVSTKAATKSEAEASKQSHKTLFENPNVLIVAAVFGGVALALLAGRK